MKKFTASVAVTVSSTVCIDRHSASRVRSDMPRSSCLILLNAGWIGD